MRSPQPEPQSNKESINTDANKLFMKDIKTFLNLKKVANNCQERKRKTSNALSLRNSYNNSSVIVAEKNGIGSLKIMYEAAANTQVQKANQLQNMDVELDTRLCAVA